MADLSIREAQGVFQISVDASATRFNPGDLIAYNGTAFVKADADAATNLTPQFISMEAVQAGGSATHQLSVCRKCMVVDTDAPWTAGLHFFVSGTAGAFSQTQPTAAAGTMQRVVGKAFSTSAGYLNVEIPHIVVTMVLKNTEPATAANYSNFWIAPFPVKLINALESHTVAGSDGGAVTLTVEKLSATEALDAGTVILATTFNLKSTADTPVAVAPHATAATSRVATGQRLGLKDAGTLTAVAGVVVTLTFVEDR